MSKGAVVEVVYTGVKVFSATKAVERDKLGDHVTDWLLSHPKREVVSTVVSLSSDSEFHCLVITVFHKERA